MNTDVARLAPEQLAWRCSLEELRFESTDEVPPLQDMVGQERGLGAIAFGLGLDMAGYNLYVAGPIGTGRTTTVKSRVQRAAAERPSPPDWCYLHNFREPSQPIAVQLPTGQGPELAQDLDQFIALCQREIPKVFESEQYQRRRTALMQALDRQRQALLDDLRALADKLGFAIQFTQMGIVTLPLVAPGQPMGPEAFDLLPDARKAEIRANGQRLQQRVDEVLLLMRRLEREAHEQVHALDREAVGFAVGHAIDALRAKYASHRRVVEHLSAVQADLIDHLEEFRTPPGAITAQTVLPQRPVYERYRVNVLVSNEPANGAPVVSEPNPTYYNLLGRIDYRAAIGAMQTDFTLVRAGALHRANGGYLVLQARDLLLSPFAWDALKRSLRDGEVRVENLGEQLSAFPTAALKPEPIPLNVKVVLIGDLTTYMLLYRLDEDFQKFFKVKAQFGPDMTRTAESLQAYAAFISGQVEAQSLPPFRKEAVARVIELGARLASHQDRLSTRFNAVAEVVVEAAYWARQAKADSVTAEHVDRAVAEQEQRLNLTEEQLQRLIDEGTVAIDTRAAVVGQVNGISVIDRGDYAFGRPSRITARVGPGADGVVNIEREVELSGRTHSKGVLILSGYLLGKYARERPLALSARLVFEQMYSEVDGDSASSAELYALLSALSDLPLRQGIAVTGSINQRGEIQAVGGVTQKIEGFFAVCKAQGLTGEQGVIIPQSNVRHLMLKQEVVDAVARQQFHVWAIRTCDEGIELLTGRPAGQARPDGSYPPGSVHALVQERLEAFAARLAEFGDRHRLAPPGSYKPSRGARGDDDSA